MKYYNVDSRADYAEMFEAISEYSSEKIPRGTSVILVGDKIRPATSGEVPFGIISSFPIMIGNSSGMEWKGKYLRDEFGNFLLGQNRDGKMVMQLSPDYDPMQPYTQRLDRPEWNMVGLVGKVKMLKNQPIAPAWVKLKDITDNVEEWLIK